jgi:hypothetical protein
VNPVSRFRRRRPTGDPNAETPWLATFVVSVVPVVVRVAVTLLTAL